MTKWDLRPYPGMPSGPTMGWVHETQRTDHRIRVTRRRFPCAVESVPAVRRFIAHAVRRDSEVQVAALLTSELATNSIVHANSEIVVTVVRRPDATYVLVYDAGPGVPMPRAPTSDEASGRGLFLVGALADAWGVQTHDVGKSVWFVLRHRIEGAVIQPAGWRQSPVVHDSTSSDQLGSPPWLASARSSAVDQNSTPPPLAGEHTAGPMSAGGDALGVARREHGTTLPPSVRRDHLSEM